MSGQEQERIQLFEDQPIRTAWDEGNETVTNCNQLKLKSHKDGKRYKTDVANTVQLLRIIQSIPSKKAEPFKIWLAEVGRDGDKGDLSNGKSAGI